MGVSLDKKLEFSLGPKVTGPYTYNVTSSERAANEPCAYDNEMLILIFGYDIPIFYLKKNVQTIFPSRIAVEGIKSVPSVCVWVYSGYIILHYNGIWATCAPGRRNMHHSGAICTTVHKGDYVF